MKGVIYKISFNNYDKVYIGQSINFKNRMKYHKSQLKSNKHYNIKLQRSYNKHIKNNNIIFEILEECNQDKLNDKELFYINKFDSFKNGLNCTSGGDNIIKTSTKLIYQYCSITGKLLNSCFGYKNTERLTGINESNIRQICNNKMKTAKGFHFSLLLKNKNQVLLDIIPNYKKESYKIKSRERMLGNKNPMFGKKRPELSGKLSPLSSENYKREEKRLLFTNDELVYLNTKGITQKILGELCRVSQVTISSRILKYKK